MHPDPASAPVPSSALVTSAIFLLAAVALLIFAVYAGQQVTAPLIGVAVLGFLTVRNFFEYRRRTNARESMKR